MHSANLQLQLSLHCIKYMCLVRLNVKGFGYYPITGTDEHAQFVQNLLSLIQPFEKLLYLKYHYLSTKEKNTG